VRSAQGKHKLSTQRHGRQRREKGEIHERPVAPCDAPSQELLSAREHMKRGTMDEGWWVDEPSQGLPGKAAGARPPRTAAGAQPPAKKRPRFDRAGNVAFVRPGALGGWEGVESPATALVVVGKRMGQPPITGGSPRYVIARPLAGGPEEEWHISQLESSGERLPGLYRAFKEAEEPMREKLRVLIARVVREQHRNVAVPIETLFEQVVPGGVWAEVA
jgi:hypothetical protein